MKLAMFLNIFLFSAMHPMMMILILIPMSIIIIMMIILITKMTMMSMLILLMMLGGIIILFIYMSSISQNNNMMNNMFLILLPFIMILPMNESSNYTIYKNTDLMQLFNTFSFINSTMVIMYLLFSLYVILKIINKLNYSLNPY